MESWQINYITVEISTPVRCGDRPNGFIARTLPFVPGHVPLMAMVPPVVAALKLPDQFESFHIVREFLEKHVRFTPFLIRQHSERKPYVPVQGTAVMREIEEHFIASRYGVGIDYPTRTAKEGRLFEIEAINPLDRDGNKTVLEGYVFWRSGKNDRLELDEKGNLNDVDLSQRIQECQWGGERSKGYGCIGDVERVYSDMLWGAEVVLDGYSPQVNWPQNNPAPFFLDFNSALEKVNQKISPDLSVDSDLLSSEGSSYSDHIEGSIKPMVGRIFDKENGSGQTTSNPLILYDIGWHSSLPLTLQIETRATALVPGFPE